jgi:hypothetical protein
MGRATTITSRAQPRSRSVVGRTDLRRINETNPFLAGHWAKKAEDTKRIQPQIAYGLMGIDSPAVEFK